VTLATVHQSSLPDAYWTMPSLPRPELRHAHIPCACTVLMSIGPAWPHLTHSCGTIHIPAALSLPPYQRGDRDNKFLFSKSKSEFRVLIIKFEV